MLWILSLATALAAPPEGAWAKLDSDTGWREVGSRSTDVGEIKVRWLQIDELPCVEGRVSTPISPAILAAVASDIETDWSNAPVTISKILRREGATIDFFQYLDIPEWTLVADRYWFARGVTSPLEGGGQRFRWTRLEGKDYPAVSKPLVEAGQSVEVPVNFGDWLFRPKDGATEVRYRICTDSGGSLPYWLQKWAALRTLPDTVADLVREAAKRAAN